MKKITKKLLYVLSTVFIICGMLLLVPGPLGADNIPVTGITVTGADTVVNGGSITLGATVTPLDATNSSVTWSVATLAGGTATIDAATGVLSATGVGTVTVTATAVDGSGVTGTKDVKITSAETPVTNIPVTGITVTGAETVVNGGSITLGATVTPSDATISSVTWSVTTLAGGTATIDANTGVLSATGVGTVTVTAAANDGSGVTGTKDVTITSADTPAYHNTLGIEIGSWTTNETGESGRQTYISVGSDCIGQRYRLIISGTGNIYPSSFGDTTGFITDTTWYHVCNFSVILEPGDYTATLYIGKDLNNNNVLEPEEALTYVYSESFTITAEQPHGSGTLDVSPGISGGNTTVSLHGIDAQGVSILLWIFKFDGTWSDLLEIGNNSDGNEVFQYLVYGTIPDFGDEMPDVTQLEGFFTIDSNDWYKDVNVILQQGHYFAIVFPIIENTGPDDFLVKEFSINDGVNVPVSVNGSNPILSTDKADYNPGETVSITGTGFLPNTSYTIIVTRPDGSIVIGDGSFTPGSDSITADNNGNFIYQYELDGIEGRYLVRAINSAGNTVAETDFTDSKSEAIAASDDPIPGSGEYIQELAFTGVDPIIPLSGTAASIIGLILIIISIRNEQQRNWKHAIGYCDRER